jgi:hypothetical protein
VAVGYRILLFLAAPRAGCSFYLAAGFLVVRARYPHAPQLQESSGFAPPFSGTKIFLVPFFSAPAPFFCDQDLFTYFPEIAFVFSIRSILSKSQPEKPLT